MLCDLVFLVTGFVSLKLYAQYGDFYRDYVERVLQAAPIDDPRLPIALTHFVLDPDWSSIQQHADSVLGDMEPHEGAEPVPGGADPSPGSVEPQTGPAQVPDSTGGN